MTEKNLVATFGTDDYAAIAAEMGANVGSDNSFLPSLRINRQPTDDSDNPLPVGSYCIQQDGVMVFGKPVLFRVFMNTYQYMEWNDQGNKVLNKSIVIKSFSEQAMDELGGTKCGKLSAKDFEAAKQYLNTEQIARQKNMKCYRNIYGTITIEDAVTSNKTKTTIENLPVVWRLSGTNFNAPKDALAAMDKIKHLYVQHNLKLDTKREKNGANVYYVSVVEPILNKDLGFDQQDIGTYGMFRELIERENRFIVNKWKSAQKVSAESVTNYRSALAELELNDDISDL